MERGARSAGKGGAELRMLSYVYLVRQVDGDGSGIGMLISGCL